MPVDIVIVSFNTEDLLRTCLQSVRDHAGDNEIHAIVVDNGSSDGSPDMARAEFPEVSLVELDENIGFGGGNNRGVTAGSAAQVLLLNSDAVLTEGALDSMQAMLEAHEDAIAVGPRLNYLDGRFQASCRRFPSLAQNYWNLSGLQARFPERPRCLQNWLTEAQHVAGRVDMVSGACVLLRRAYFESVGGFDENLFLYEEEPDLFLPGRARGEYVYHCPEAIILHGHGSSVSQNEMTAFAKHHTYRSKYYLFRKHFSALHARLAYGSDLFVFYLSLLVNDLRGRDSTSREQIKTARSAFQASRVPMKTLRADGWPNLKA
jgi:hypothetical protein